MVLIAFYFDARTEHAAFPYVGGDGASHLVSVTLAEGNVLKLDGLDGEFSEECPADSFTARLSGPIRAAVDEGVASSGYYYFFFPFPVVLGLLFVLPNYMSFRKARRLNSYLLRE